MPEVKTPTFVKAEVASSIARAPVQLSAGENWAWDVRWRGLKVGTARLEVLADKGALRIESVFRTAGVAKDTSQPKHHLVTRLDGSDHPKDDLHTAFGRIRSWAHPRAAPATLALWHEGGKYIVDLAQPILDDSDSGQRLRVEGRVRSDSLSLDLTLLLATDASHAPMQITLIHKGQQVNARLLERDS